MIHGTVVPHLSRSSSSCAQYGTNREQFLLEHLDADIICFQEHKLQRKDITFTIANIPGFEGYFSFSKVKKGYSGVLIIVEPTDGLGGNISETELSMLKSGGRTYWTVEITFRSSV